MSHFVRSTCMKVTAGLIFLLLLQPACAQYNFSKLDELLGQNQKVLGNNAVALIYRNGSLIYQKQLGDFSPDTQEQIASCSKWLTAALVMTFIDEGRLSLDDKVSTYLPIFAKYGKGYITIRECLSHTTGIQGDHPGLMGILKLSRYHSLEDEVNDFASKNEIEANPGTEFSYSSIGLNIAGRILEVISRKPFDQLMLQRIFRPLGMKNSTFSSERAVNPSGGARSTATDYMKFLEMILNQGMYQGKRILSVNAIREMETTQTSLQMIRYAPKVASGYNYALGEWVEETDGAGNATTVTSPGLFGTWPLVDLKRKYAAIFFVKSLLSDSKREVYLAAKTIIDEQIDRN